MLAEVREPVEPDERRGRGRDEHLPAVAYGRDPSSAVHVVSDVAFVRHERRACVQADAHMDRAGRQRLCKRSRSCERAGRRREGEEERISLGVDLDPALGRTRLSYHPTVLGECLGVRLGPERLQELRRALDVRKEERDGASREIVAHAT